MRTTRTVVNSNIMNRILLSMEKKGVRQVDLMRHLGITDQVFTKWKYENSKSYLKYMDEIADYLNVTVDYLMNGTENGTEYPQEDVELLNLIHELSKPKRKLVRNIIIELSSI